MIILSIETSCDDTAIAVVEVGDGKKPQFKILANIVSSQVKIHQKYGGVYPTLAKREHQKNLVPVLTLALKKAKLLKKSGGRFRDELLEKILKRERILLKKTKTFLKRHKKPKIDLISVTIGPGLEPCLWVGVNFARALGYSWELPVFAINHIEAHIFANLIERENGIVFPALALIVSGGHTQLILMEGLKKYKILGETRDDAAGECFDKGAKILGLKYPGGPEIETAASKFIISNSQFSICLPRPMIHQKNYDFSFSGLKTAILYDFMERPKKTRRSKKYIQEMSYKIQEAIVDVLISKTIRATKEYEAKTIILGGGVAANSELRKQFQLAINNQQLTIKFLVPPKILCTDNAAMSAVAAYFHWQKNRETSWKNIKANANLRIT